MITPTQMRAARAMLSLSQGEVAKHLGIAANTLSNIENAQADAPASRLLEIQKFYEYEGLEFTEGEGVRQRQDKVQRYHGVDGFKFFMDDVYNVAKAQGGEICLYNARPANWIKWLGVEWNAFHSQRMKELAGRINFKITAQRGDYQFIGSKHAEYRWVPDHLWNERSFYAYGDKIGFLNFEEDSVEIFVLKQKQFADSFRSLFNIVWDTVTIIPDVENNKPGQAS